MTSPSFRAMRGIAHPARNDGRGMNPSELRHFEVAETAYLAESGVRRRGGDPLRRLSGYEAAQNYHEALMRYVTLGKGRVANQMWEGDLRTLQERAQSGIAGSAGGFLLSEQLHSQIIASKAAVGGIASVAFTLDTEDARAYPVPKIDATGEVGALIEENEKDTEGTDADFGRVTLGGWGFTSRFVRVRRDLLEDSQHDIAGHLTGRLGARLARAEAPKYVTGTGLKEPQGVLSAEGLEVGSTATGTSTVTRAELVGLEASLDDAYLADAAFVLSPSAEQTLKAEEVDDGAGNPTGQAKYPEMSEGRLVGRTYVVEQNMPDMATGNTPILILSPQAFWVRQAGPARLVRVDQGFDAGADPAGAEGSERLVDFDVGFVATEQVDSGLVDPAGVRALVLS